MQPVTKGYLYGIAAAAFYGLNPLFTLPLYQRGMDTDSVLFYRYLLSLLMLGLLMKLRHISFRVKAKQLLSLALLGLLYSISSITLFLSYHYMDVGVATTVLYVFPVIVMVIMLVRYHERISGVALLAVLMVFFGLFLLARNGSGEMLSSTGFSLSLASAASYAFYIVFINHSEAARLPLLKQTFYVVLFGMFIYVVRLRGGVDLCAIPGPVAWANLWLLMLFPSVISLLCLSRGIQLAGPTPISILGALEPITATAVGVFAFGELLTPRIAIGILVIIVAVSLVIMKSKIVHIIRRFIRN